MDSTRERLLRVQDITSKESFIDSLLRSVLTSEPRFENDNVDVAYPAAGAIPGGSDPLCSRTDYFKFVLRHDARLFATFRALEDTASRELFLALILFRILGYNRVRLPVDHATYFAEREKVRSMPVAPSAVDTPGFGHYEFQHDGRTVHLDCLDANIFFSFFRRQYYFNRPGITIAPRSGDTVIDAGACFGDTGVHFASTVGPSGHVYCFEALQSHLDIIERNLRQNPDLSNVTVFPHSLSNRDRDGPIPEGPCNPGFKAPRGAPCRTLDSLVRQRLITKVDFIKMDIEGSELRALEGAGETIKEFQPRLAISVYHSPHDYFRIPALIKHLSVAYRLFLDNYTISDGETILYATPAPSPTIDLR